MSIAQAISETRKNLLRLQREDNGRAPIGIVELLIRDTTWWLTHPTGHPVRAPGHFERIHERGGRNEIEFGANSFLVERAILRCAETIRDTAELVETRGKLFDRAELWEKLVKCLRQSVSNYCGDGYDGYPIRGGFLEFGSTGICVTEFVDAIWQRMKLDGITEVVPDENVSRQITSKLKPAQ